MSDTYSLSSDVIVYLNLKAIGPAIKSRSSDSSLELLKSFSSSSSCYDELIMSIFSASSADSSSAARSSSASKMMLSCTMF